ncbi:MAG: flagellar basal body rod protein FlgB [Roseiarcus sp.]
MDLTQIPLFKAMAKRLAWLSQRQTVLAENVANANTPGYQAADLKPLDFGTLVSGAGKSLKLAATAPGHFAGGPGTTGTGFARETPASASERGLNGNSVGLEDQMMKVSQTATDYAFTASLYKKQIALLKAAIGAG